MIRIGGTKNSSSALMAYPGFGYPGLDAWRVHVSGLAWQTPVVLNRRQRMMIRMLGGVMKVAPEDLETDIFQGRILPFMAETDHKLSILITINGVTHRMKKKTRRNGQFHGWLNISPRDIEAAVIANGGHRAMEYSVSIEDESVEPVKGMIHLYRTHGISVVSDIDDTIKDSEVGDRRELLVNTFLREFRSVSGMAEVYNRWFETGASFHYVSSSPWQLFESLCELNSVHGFPIGTMHLRKFRLRDQFLKRVMLRRKGKGSAIKTLIKNMPGRHFVLVGDSVEKDTKIYAKICRKYPDRIKGVFIRQLSGYPVESEQFSNLKASIPSGICETYSSSEELLEMAQPIFG
jgi:hypothetical protein